MLLIQNEKLTLRTLPFKGYKLVKLVHILQVCLAADMNKNKWYLDSGCSRHMTGDKSKLRNL